MARKLLVADQDPAQLRVALQIVRALDFEVYSAADGASALEQIREHRVHLVVLDWTLPKLPGGEICRLLKDLPWSVHSIVLTAHGTQEDLAAALEAGASDYLVKPFTPGELRARLQVGARILALHEHAEHTHRLESIGQLAAGIAHEINTPAQYVSDNLLFLKDSVAGLLRAIDAQDEVLRLLARGEPVRTELIQKTQDVMKQADLDYAREEIPLALAQSIEGIERVARIVRAMRQFSQSGGAQRTFVDLNRSIQSTLTLSHGEWKQVADVNLDLDPELPDVACTPGEINQVVLNLIMNAAQAIAGVGGDEQRRGRIGISTRQDGSHVRIAISDTGPGIPPEIRERIFEPFFSTREVGKGAGQGLARAYDVIVRQHSGTIEFESESGKGTTFTIRLPISPLSVAPASASASP